MFSNLQRLYSTRELIWSWTLRTIRSRYQQSILGWLWAIIQPVASVAIFAIVFTVFIPIDTGETPYILFVYVAMVPWTFFATSITDMANSLVLNMGLVTRIYFPRETIPIGVMLARFIDFLIASAIIIVLLVVYRIPLYPLGWIYVLLTVLVEIILILSVGLITAAMNVFFRDVDPFLRLSIQVLLYASPIIYPVSRVPERLQTLYFLNPMAGIIESFRSVLLYQTPPGYYLVTSTVISIILLVIGYYFFKRVERSFADIV